MDGWIINQRLLVEDRIDRYRDEARAERLVAEASALAMPVAKAHTAPRATERDPGRVVGEPIAHPATRPVTAEATSVGGQRRAAADCGCSETVAAA